MNGNRQDNMTELARAIVPHFRFLFPPEGMRRLTAIDRKYVY